MPSTTSSSTATAFVRYGAKPDGWARPDGGGEPTWTDALEALYLTDEDAVRAVVPPPLEPAVEPRVRFTIATWTDPGGAVEGEARVTVQVRHGEEIGEYPLFVAHTVEARMHDARELRGEPAKMATVDSSISGRRIENKVKRLGYAVGRIVGTVDAADRPSTRMLKEFTFRTRRDPGDGCRLAVDPTLCLVRRNIEERRATVVAGLVRLGQSPFDPLRALPVRVTQSVRLSQQFVRSTVTDLESVPAADYEPYLHQHYDDLSALDRWR